MAAIPNIEKIPTDQLHKIVESLAGKRSDINDQILREIAAELAKPSRRVQNHAFNRGVQRAENAIRNATSSINDIPYRKTRAEARMDPDWDFNNPLHIKAKKLFDNGQALTKTEALKLAKIMP